MKMNRYTTTILIIATCFFYSCEDFLTGENLDNNPNKVDDVDQISVESLFVGSQVTLYGVMQGYLSRALRAYPLPAYCFLSFVFANLFLKPHR